MFFMRRLLSAHFLIVWGIKMKIGIKRKFSKNGRLVIPIEYREFYHFEDGDEVEIIALPEGLLITNPNYEMVKKDKKTLDFDAVKR